MAVTERKLTVLQRKLELLLLGARTLLGAPGLTTSNKNLLETISKIEFNAPVCSGPSCTSSPYAASSYTLQVTNLKLHLPLSTFHWPLCLGTKAWARLSSFRGISRQLCVRNVKIGLCATSTLCGETFDFKFLSHRLSGLRFLFDHYPAVGRSREVRSGLLHAVHAHMQLFDLGCLCSDHR